MDYVTLLFRVVITNQKCKTITRKIQWKDEQATGFIKEKTPLTSSVFVMQTLCRRSFFNENLATVLGYDWEEWTPIELKEWKEVARLSRYAIEKARFYFNSIGKNGNPTAHYN